MSMEGDWSPIQREAIELLLRLVESGFNLGQLNALDEFISPTVVDHEARSEDPAGIEGMKARIRMIREAFPDALLQVDDVLVDGPKVAWRWTLTGTHRGPVLGLAPTGKSVRITGIGIERVEGGQIAEHWNVSDSTILLKQLKEQTKSSPPHHA
jgi:predicted ester cyclase